MKQSFRGQKPKRKQKNQSKGGPEEQSAAQRDLIPERLPAVQDQLAVAIRLRFVATAAFTGQFAVSVSNLLDAWFIAGTATTAYQLFDFVKVKKVTIRSMGVAQPFQSGVVSPAPPMATVGVEFVGLNAGTLAGGKQSSDTALGYDKPAFVSIKPDPMSQVAQFQSSSGNTLFYIRAVDHNANSLAGTVVDVDVVYRNSADVNPAAVGVARAALVPGDLYFGGLDGQPLASTQMRSVFVRRA